MDLQLADQAYVEGSKGGAEIVCKNMFAAPKPATDGRNYELKACPGLEAFVTLSGFVRGVHSDAGLFNGDIFAVAGDEIVRIDREGVITTLGAVAATGSVTIAATRTEVGFCIAPKFYVYDGTGLTEVIDEDLPDVYSVTALYQRFILTDENDRHYWTDLLDGGSIDGLNFFTAESHPDKLIRVLSDGEKYYAMGAVSIEVNGAVTNPQSDANAFARIGSGVIKSGLAGLHAVAVDVDSLTIAFLGHERSIYITQGYETQTISTPYIETLLEGATEAQIEAARCFSYREAGETFFVLSIPDIATFVFGKRMQKWHLRETLGQKNWRADQHVRAFGSEYVASSNDSVIWRMSKSILTDSGLLMSKEFSASAPVRSKSGIKNIVVDGYADRAASVGMRRRKAGKKRLWGSWVDKALQSPDSGGAAIWRRLGKVLPPEQILHFRITDSADISISGVRVNDGDVR